MSSGEQREPTRSVRFLVVELLDELWSRARRHWFWIVLGAVLIVLVVGTRLGSLEVDTKPTLYLNPWDELRASLSAWQVTPALGRGSFEVGMAPIAALVWLIQSLGASPWLSARLLRVLLYLVGSIGAYVLTRDLGIGGRRGWLAARAAAVGYLANPYVLVAGATLPVLWPYAVLPWQVLTVVRAMQSRRWAFWGVLFGMSVLAMTGQNAGSVPMLQLLAMFPIVLVWAARTFRRGFLLPLRFSLVAATSSLLLSAYWLLPSVAAVGVGSSIVQQSESPQSIAAPSSFAEVIRGLGLWPLYGRTGSQPWVVGQTAVITSALVVAAGFAVVLLALAFGRRAPLRELRLPVSLLAGAAVVMVGVHPFGSPSPAGRLWSTLLDAVPVLGVLRTTNKAGAVLVLAVAMLIGAGVHARRWYRLRGASMAAVLAVAILPAWTGGLFVSSANIPSYWRAAADSIGTGAGRVLLLPGEDSADYTWSDARPDDVVQALLSRESIVATTVPNTSREGANLLSMVDARLQEGTMPAGALAPYARYLGASTVVVRNDLVWAAAGGAPPSLVSAEVRGATGLTAGARFGAPTKATDGEMPVEIFQVTSPSGPVTLAPAGQSLVLVGDGAAIPDLGHLGYLDGQPSFRYAVNLTAARLSELGGTAARFLITDTNRRSETVPGRLTEGHGPLLSAEQDPVSTRALGTADDQTVRVPQGWQAFATREGSVFRTLPWAAARNAVDGDPSTAWFAGDFGGAVGQRLSVDFGPAPGAGEIDVHTVGLGNGAVTGLALSADGQDLSVREKGDGVFQAELPASAMGVVITITSVRGSSFDNVGISEVTVNGHSSPVTDTVRTPLTLSRLVEALPAAAQQALSSQPVDVLLTRVTGASSSARAEENNLRRSVVLPWSNAMAVHGLFRLGSPMPETQLDRMDGDQSGIEATSSSQAFGLPTLRASMAIDGDSGTGWSPAEPAVGQYWQARLGSPRELRTITIRQPESGRQLTEVSIAVNGQLGRDVSLHPGLNTVDLPAVTEVRSLRITVVAASVPASSSARLLEVGLGDAHVTRSGGSPQCITVATIDGVPVEVRPTADITSASFLATDCSPSPRTMSAGTHVWQPKPGWVGDNVVWADMRTPFRTAARGTSTVVTTPAGLGSGWTARLPATAEPTVLASGVGYDPGWHLSLNGRDQGPPVVVDGYAAGWVLPAGGPRTAALGFVQQRRLWLGLAATGMSLLGGVAFLVWVRRHAGRRVAGPQRPERPGWLAALAVRLGTPGTWIAFTGLSTLCAWFFVGAWGILSALVGVLIARFARPALWMGALAAWVAVPVSWFWQSRGVFGQVTPDLVTRTPVAGTLAGSALVLTVLAVVLGESHERAGACEGLLE